MSDRVTIRLRSLADPIRAHCESLGQSVSEYFLSLAAADLGLAKPEQYSGNPDIGSRASEGARARWKGKNGSNG